MKAGHTKNNHIDNNPINYNALPDVNLNNEPAHMHSKIN